MWQITDQNKSMEIYFQEHLLHQVKYDSSKVHRYLCKTGNHREQYSGYKCLCCILEVRTCWNQGKHKGCTKLLKHTYRWGWQHWRAGSWPRGQSRDGKEIRLQADAGMVWVLLPIIWQAQVEGILWPIYSSNPSAVLRGTARQKQVREVQRK